MSPIAHFLKSGSFCLLPLLIAFIPSSHGLLGATDGLRGISAPSSVSRAAAYVPPPLPSVNNPAATGWPKAQEKWRRGLLRRSKVYVKELSGRLQDDGPPDSSLWRNLSHFNGTDGDGTIPWKLLCNQGVMVNPLPDPLRGWAQLNGSECSAGDYVKAGIGDEDLSFSTSAEALAKCGQEQCSSIVNNGCKGEKFRVCKKGAAPQTSPSGSCLRTRPAGQKPSKSTGPRAPQQTDFWKKFCAHNDVAVPFRLLFPERLCSAGIALTGNVESEGQCADLVSANAECSRIFDFEEAADAAAAPVCRCLGKTAKCAAGATKKPKGNVYIIGG